MEFICKGENRKIGNLMLLFIFVISIIISFIIRFPKQDEGFALSDASYYVLFTMESYDEISPRVHQFLPIQTLGDSSDKYINNGPSLVQDEYGNNMCHFLR